jgi:hypothetical protein
VSGLAGPEAIILSAPERAVFAMSYDPELISTMRAALNDVMTQIPVEQATLDVKIRLAEFILKAAADGQTSYEALHAEASSQIQTVLPTLT